MKEFNMADAPDWQGKNIELVKEASRHGESMLAAQVGLATSADQRAAVLAGIFTAVATGIIGAIATQSTLSDHRALMVGACVAVTAYLIGAGLCVITALPIPFWTPGNDPAEWYGDIEKNRALVECVGEQTAFFSKHIGENNVVLNRNGKLFFAGAVIGVSAPLLAIVTAGITCLLG